MGMLRRTNLDIKEVEKIKKDYESVQMRLSKIEAIQSMKVKEALVLIKKYGFSDLKDWKKLVELRDSKRPELDKLIAEVREYISSSEEQLREIENNI